MITFKKQPKETGLRAVGQGPQAYDIRVNGKAVGTVYPVGGGWRAPLSGWYFVVPEDIARNLPFANTCQTPCDTEAEAKAQAKAFILAHLKEQS